ncbi:hypothetical protein TrVGV298_011028 [Trichoderma virens]|nr:hypothetical protein TrVGV298_011028 [Trichoderma virens]
MRTSTKETAAINSLALSGRGSEPNYLAYDAADSRLNVTRRCPAHDVACPVGESFVSTTTEQKKPTYPQMSVRNKRCKNPTASSSHGMHRVGVLPIGANFYPH